LETRSDRKKQNDVVIVELAEIDAFFAKVGGVGVEALRFQYQLNRLSSGAVVLNQQNAHAICFLATSGWSISHPYG
jgi:hypothetical protein